MSVAQSNWIIQYFTDKTHKARVADRGRHSNTSRCLVSTHACLVLAVSCTSISLHNSWKHNFKLPVYCLLSCKRRRKRHRTRQNQMASVSSFLTLVSSQTWHLCLDSTIAPLQIFHVVTNFTNNTQLHYVRPSNCKYRPHSGYFKTCQLKQLSKNATK